MAGATQPANNVVGRLIQRCLRVHRPALQGIESKHTTIHNMERSTKSPQGFAPLVIFDNIANMLFGKVVWVITEKRTLTTEKMNWNVTINDHTYHCQDYSNDQVLIIFFIMGFIVRQKRTIGRSLGRIIPVEDSDLEYPNPPLEDEDDIHENSKEVKS
ncbi:hypothetical protein Tco_0598767 [Tanacetum coccineum]